MGVEFVFSCKCNRSRKVIDSLLVLMCVHRVFDISPFKSWSLIPLSLSMGCTWNKAVSGGREKEAADTKAGNRTDSGTSEEKQGKENVGIIRSYSRLAV